MTTLTMPAQESPRLMPVYPHLPFEPASGEGVWLTTRDGRRLLDFYGGHAVALLGYGHPRLLAALAEQAKTLFFQSNITPLAVRSRAAEALAAFAPRHLSQVFFVNSGAEANENALRIALRKTGRKRVVAIQGAFHGRTAAAAAVTHGAARWYGFPRAPFEVDFLPRNDESAIAALVTEDTAAVIAEPVQGQAGAYVLEPGFLAALRDRTRLVGACLIFDEVQCGMGRMGEPFAAQLMGVTPDLLTVAKGLAGGFPAGAVLARPEWLDVLAPGDLGTTFGGGPLACALIETVLAVIEQEGLLPRVRHLSARLKRECRLGPVVDVQGEGFLLGLRTTRPAKQIVLELIERGVLAGGAADPHIVRLLPPLVLEDEHVDTLVAALAEIPA